MTKKSKKADAAQIKTLAKKLFLLMGTKAEVSVTKDKENEAFRVDIKTDKESGLLIGRHGETLDAIQATLRMILFQHTGESARIIANLGDWREKQAEKLSEVSRQAAERAKTTGEPQNLYNLSPPQRRQVHMELAEDKEIDTESFGEEGERYLVIRPKS